MTRTVLLLSTVAVLAACAGPQVTQVQALSETADAPYNNILVISLFESFDVRRNVEKEIVKQLDAKGITAIASTSQMDTRTPVTRETFQAMADSLASDAVLVTQLVNLQYTAKMKDMNPEAT